MIKVYKIKVADKVYEVEVESITEKEGTIVSKEKKEEVVPKVVAQNGGVKVESPMQGVIIEILVKVGDTVKAGDTLATLEAMKMENPIVAPQGGIVASIVVGKGDTVDGGDLLITLS
ncbi:MAG: biotin/lipoyl-containing protein [Fusobacteriaceae bacterium]